MAQAQIIQEDFSGGINQDAAPHLLDETEMWDALNVVLDDDGSAYRRGCPSVVSSSGMTGPGRWVWDGLLNVGRRTLLADASKTYVLDADGVSLVEMGPGVLTAPQTAVMGGVLWGGGGLVTAGARSNVTHTASGVSVTNGSRTVTRSSGSWSGVLVPGHLMRLGSGRLYEVESVDSATQVTLREPYKEATASGQSVTFRSIWWSPGGDYPAGDYVVACHNRLVWAKGRRVWFSAIGDPHSYGANDYHELPIGAVICGLAELGGTLLVLTTDGVWTIDGLAFNIVDASGNGQHRIQRLSEQLVCAGAAGVAGYEQRLIVPSSDGIYLMDGVSTPERISKGIERPYRAWIKWGAKLGQATVFQGHYMLPIVSPLGDVRDMFLVRLDRSVKSRWRTRTYPWVRFGGDGGEIPAFAVRHGEDQLAPRLLGVQGADGARLVDCSAYFRPDVESVDPDGAAPVARIVSRDFAAGNGTLNVVRSVRLRYELDAGSLRVEESAGGPDFSVDGSGPRLRVWGDPDAEWGHVDGKWGLGFGPEIPASGGAPAGPTWGEVGPAPGPSDGISPVKCRVDRRRRFIRYRVTCDSTVQRFRVRGLETFVRESRAVRR